MKPCIISRVQERELINILYNHKHNAFPHIQNWFRNFRASYGLDFQKTVGKHIDQDDELAESFLNQHGTSNISLKAPTRYGASREERMQIPWQDREYPIGKWILWGIFLFIVLFFILIACGGGVKKFGSNVSMWVLFILVGIFTRGLTRR